MEMRLWNESLDNVDIASDREVQNMSTMSFLQMRIDNDATVCIEEQKDANYQRCDADSGNCKNFDTILNDEEKK